MFQGHVFFFTNQSVFSRLGLVGLVGYFWRVQFGRFGLVGLLWLVRFGLLGLVWEVWFY